VSKPLRVVIIGGGITGLATAYICICGKAYCEGQGQRGHLLFLALEVGNVLFLHSAVGVRSETRLAGRSDGDEVEPDSSAGGS
jgi:thioredoxin reductase